MRENDMPCCETLFWVFLVICLVLLSFAGITSGLALGLLSFRKVDLEVLIKAGHPQAQKNAAKILPLVKNEHLLLCTLLVGKSLAMGALPIFLDSIVPAWAAIAASVILVFAFAEIIPQALCSRYGLTVGAKLSLLVRFLLLVFFPISYPISKLLDWLLGKEHCALFRRPELKTLVALHANEAGKGGDLSHHETSIIAGALDLTQKTAKDAMTPISETFSLDINSKLTMQTMGLVMSKGHSRIPIYFGKPNNIIGLILVKNLIFCRPEDETPVKYLTLRRMPRVYDDWPLYDILNQFMMGSSHMALVVKRKKDINKAENDAVAKCNMLCTTSNLDTKQLGRKGLVFPIYQEEHLSATIDSPLYSSDIESQSTTMNNVMEQDKYLHPRYEDIESFSTSLDEEVIGIITLEDVMEELLQEEIVDETDKYVDVHNKIKVNPLASIPSSRSLRRSSFSHLQLINSEPASLSSWSSPTLHTFTFPHIQPPLIKPTLSASLVKSLPNSPARSRSTFRSSSFGHRLSRMSQENLQLPNQL